MGELQDTMDHSSPVSDTAEMDANILTPRSKVAKMLADIDNAPTPSQTAAPRKPSPLASKSAEGHDQSPNAGQRNDATDSDEDDDLVSHMRRQRGLINGTHRPSLGGDLGQEGHPSSLTRLGDADTGVATENEEVVQTPVRRKLLRASDTTSATRSPALFVSPTGSPGYRSDDSELPSNPFAGQGRFAALVAKKRQERLDREREQSGNSVAIMANETAESSSPRTHSQSVANGSQDIVNQEVDRIMSDASRPTRKASKKALLEMERETQRLARQQALAHQMKVKRKYTTDDLLAKFNFRFTMQPPARPDAAGESSASSAPNSDGVEDHTFSDRPREPVSTPPSSPPTAGRTPLEKQRAIVEQGALSKLMPAREDSLVQLAQGMDDQDLPDIAEVLQQSQRAAVLAPIGLADPGPVKRLRWNTVRTEIPAAANHDESSDEELEIIAALPTHLKAFENLRSGRLSKSTHKDSNAIHNLRHLSNMGAYEAKPGKAAKRGSKQKPSVNPRVLEIQLRRRAKEQARQLQEERIAELKAKGVEIMTIEEREREQETFEDLLEKARQEAQQLRKAEKATLKGLSEADPDAASSDEEEDDDYVGSDEEGIAADNDDDEDAEDSDRIEDGLVDDAAEESSEEEDEDESVEGPGAHVDDEEADLPSAGAVNAETTSDLGSGLQPSAQATPAPKQRRVRPSKIVPDDDEEEAEEESAEKLQAVTSMTATPVVAEDPFAAFNFDAGGAGAGLLSPTQAFQATMHTPTQAMQSQFEMGSISISSLPPTLPPAFYAEQSLDDSMPENESHSLDQNTLVPESQRISLDWETQPAPETPMPLALSRDTSALYDTPGWEPSQDGGLPSPFMNRRLPNAATADVAESVDDDRRETQETVRLRVSETPVPSLAPLPAQGKRLRRRVKTVDSSDDEETPNADPSAEEDAFREMARRRKEALTAAERAEAAREAKQMMDEQAEESEDEFAGLGGDDYVAPETEQDREMIDSSHIDVDERAIAAHYAERERARQEAETSKLYKDLTTGALRRKQANMFDLDEDDDELAIRRRQLRPREEARKRRLLLKDDNIAGLAEGKASKGKEAFLKAIADDDDRDDVLELSDEDNTVESSPAQDDSQTSQQRTAAGQPLQEVSANKRRLTEADQGHDNGRAGKVRRTQPSAFRKPASLLEVRESLSFLLDENEAVVTMESTVEAEEDSNEEGSGTLSEADEEEDLTAAELDRQNDGGFAPNPAQFDAAAVNASRPPASQRRTAVSNAVVDRLSMRRAASSSDSALGRTAWAAGPTTGGFKVPSLLRRATTNTLASTSESTRPNVAKEAGGVRMGGSKKSSLAYQARAEERKAIVEASARRRAENTAKIAQMRRNSSVMGRGLTGRFE